MKLHRLGALLLSLASMTVCANAAVNVFTNRADFLSAVNVSLTENFESYSWTSSGGNYLGSSTSLGSLSYSVAVSDQIFGVNSTALTYDADYLVGSYMEWQNSAPTTLTITFGAPVTAFGLDFGQFYGNKLGFSAKIGAFSYATSTALNAYSFVGFTSDSAFSSIQLSGATDFPIIDNLVLGESNGGVTPVPEPSTYGLMGVGGLAGLAGFRRLRRKKVA